MKEESRAVYKTIFFFLNELENKNLVSNTKKTEFEKHNSLQKEP